ncbi:MAG: hypothetical protein M0R74_19415 [Dehalococcoidia bacterium]|nr:hypothetical protein [Dehalococcoidia bacterium]
MIANAIAKTVEAKRQALMEKLGQQGGRAMPAEGMPGGPAPAPRAPTRADERFAMILPHLKGLTPEDVEKLRAFSDSIHQQGLLGEEERPSYAIPQEGYEIPNITKQSGIYALPEEEGRYRITNVGKKKQLSTRDQLYMNIMQNAANALAESNKKKGLEEKDITKIRQDALKAWYDPMTQKSKETDMQTFIDQYVRNVLGDAGQAGEIDIPAFPQAEGPGGRGVVSLAQLRGERSALPVGESGGRTPVAGGRGAQPLQAFVDPKTGNRRLVYEDREEIVSPEGNRIAVRKKVPKR